MRLLTLMTDTMQDVVCEEGYRIEVCITEEPE